LSKVALLINQNMTQNTFFTCLPPGLTVHPIVRFTTAYSKKNFKVSAYYVTTGTEMVSHFVDSSVNDVLLQTNPDFISQFLNSSTFVKVIWLTQCCMTVKQCNCLAVKAFVHFNAHIACSGYST